MKILMCPSCESVSRKEGYTIDSAHQRWVYTMRIRCDNRCLAKMAITVRSDRMDDMDEKIATSRIQLIAAWNRRARGEATP